MWDFWVNDILILFILLIKCYCILVCVKVGLWVWVRVEKGCFFCGIVIVMDDEIYVLFDNGKKIRYKKENLECVVVDVIFYVVEVEIGMRVLVKWYNCLDIYYFGIVVVIWWSFFDVRFDDGDKGCNEFRELRIFS